MNSFKRNIYRTGFVSKALPPQPPTSEAWFISRVLPAEEGNCSAIDDPVFKIEGAVTVGQNLYTDSGLQNETNLSDGEYLISNTIVSENTSGTRTKIVVENGSEIIDLSQVSCNPAIARQAIFMQTTGHPGALEACQEGLGTPVERWLEGSVVNGIPSGVIYEQEVGGSPFNPPGGAANDWFLTSFNFENVVIRIDFDGSIMQTQECDSLGSP